MFNDEQKVKIIKEKINKILSRREFQNPGKKNPLSDLINRLWESIKEWIYSILFKDRLPRKEFGIKIDTVPVWVQNVLKILLIVAAVIVVFIITRAVIKRVYFKAGKKERRNPKAADFLDNPDLAFEKVKDLIEKKDYTNAFRYLFICVLLKFHKRRIIHIEKWKTNRAYIREINTADNKLAAQMNEFSLLFNACHYGGRAVSENQLNVWLDFFESLGEDEKWQKE
ncbi:MAG TPA: hypothetical protein DCE11_08895 [Ruminiclostridium sp.]|jgi:hypothetical protein|nr:DUF4129 domain-containing protein [Clostridiaceae bacterium]HAA26211.1 hypothetical protein [Ruminiclostridium sp.]